MDPFTATIQLAAAAAALPTSIKCCRMRKTLMPLLTLSLLLLLLSSGWGKEFTLRNDFDGRSNNDLLSSSSSFLPLSPLYLGGGWNPRPHRRFQSSGILSKLLRISHRSPNWGGGGGGGGLLDNTFLDDNSLTDGSEKKRVKRFSCWHSCLGAWKRRTAPDPNRLLKLLKPETKEKVEDSEPESEPQKNGDAEEQEMVGENEEGEGSNENTSGGESSKGKRESFWFG